MERPSHVNKKRCRTKNKIKLVKQQIEFFFGDANLQRDMFLLGKTGPLGTNYVPINLLLQFKTIKNIGATTEAIITAVEQINWLQLDECKQHICRKFKLKPCVSNDHCTIYIEGLPDDATVDWMKQVCRKLGKANHIYLPRFKSGLVKGYAFVEFDQEEDVYRACNILNSPPNNFFPNRTSSFLMHHSKTVSSPVNSPTSPKLLECDFLTKKRCSNANVRPFYTSSSTGLGPNTSRTEITDHVYLEDCNLDEMLFEEFHASESDKEDVLHMDNKSALQQTSNHSEASVMSNSSRKRSVSESMVNTNDHKMKKLKFTNSLLMEDPLSSNGAATTDSLPNKLQNHHPSRKDKSRLLNVEGIVSYGRLLQKSMQKSEIAVSHVNSETVNSCGLMSVVTVPKTKTSRKKRSRKRKIDVPKQKTYQNPPHIKAIPKIIWLNLRKTYISTQREEMGKLKSILQHNAFSSCSASTFIHKHLALEENVSSEEIALPCNDNHDVAASRSLQPCIKGPIGKCGTNSFVPGVIVHVRNYKVENDQNNSVLISQIKQHFCSYGPVAYVDIQRDKGCYVRYTNAQSAQHAILEEQDYNLCLLTGVAEETYWDYLLASKQAKRSRERPKTRGRQKLVMKAMKLTCQTRKQHIKFNEDY